MTRTPRHLNPWALLIPSSMVLLMILCAAAWPSSEVRRVLFTASLCVALVLAIACIFVFAARLWSLEDDGSQRDAAIDASSSAIAELEARVSEVEARVTRHVAFCGESYQPLVLSHLPVNITQPRSA